MTTASDESGPSTSSSEPLVTPKLGKVYFDEKLCHAPTRGNAKRRIELCKTIIPVAESSNSPHSQERGPTLETPLVPSPQPSNSRFSVSYHVQDTMPYENVSKKMYTGCMVCGRSADSIQREKADEYIRRSKPTGETGYITTLRKEADLK